jgi:methionine-rich copper-binding protein CopC
MASRRWFALLVLTASLVVATPAANAHTELVSTTPKAGAYAKRSLSTVRVRFSQPIRSGRLQVLRAGEKVSLGGGQRSAEDVRAIEARIGDELEGGRYVVRWTMTAVDGHTQQGTWRFKVRPRPAAVRTATPAAEPTASAEPVATAAAAPARSEDGDDGPLWGVVGGLGLVGLLVAAGAWRKRRRVRDL